MFANPMKNRITMPMAVPVRGIIQAVGSESSNVSAAMRPTVWAMRVTAKSPTTAAQAAERWVVARRVRLPWAGHQETAPARANSTTIMKSTCLSPNGSSGWAAVNWAQLVSRKMK